MSEESDDEDTTVEPDRGISLCEAEQRETHDDANYKPTSEIRKQNQLEEFSDTFSESPNNTGLCEHRSKPMKEEPVRIKPCPMIKLGFVIVFVQVSVRRK